MICVVSMLLLLVNCATDWTICCIGTVCVASASSNTEIGNASSRRIVLATTGTGVTVIVIDAVGDAIIVRVRVFVIVCVGVMVAVGKGVLDVVTESVGIDVLADDVALAMSVAVSLISVVAVGGSTVDVSVIVAVAVLVGMRVRVGTAVGVTVSVGVSVSVGVCEGVKVLVGVNVGLVSTIVYTTPSTLLDESHTGSPSIQLLDDPSVLGARIVKNAYSSDSIVVSLV